MSTSARSGDFFEPGGKTALLCAASGVADAAAAALHELGYKFHSADSAGAALERMKYTQYDCIVVDERFAGATLQTNPILNHLAPLPMAQRRHSLVCLVGDSFKTLDALQAFGQSVHVVVNTADLSSLAPILQRSAGEFEKQYKIYREVLAERGGS